MIVALLRRSIIFCLPILGLLVGLDGAVAGRLVLRNVGQAPVTCTADGWTRPSGAADDRSFTIAPGSSTIVVPNIALAPDRSIAWVDCGGAVARLATLALETSDHVLQLNGLQTRALNVSLYAYLPVDPAADFTKLVDHVVATYQAAHPDVLLNATLDPNVDIYSFDALPGLLGKGRFDVMEIDTLYLGFLADRGVINPASMAGDLPLQVAIDAATYHGVLWAVPSWLCMDFIYGTDERLASVTSLAQLLATLPPAPSGGVRLAADYNGSWRLPSIYINAYVQRHVGDPIANALKMPPDPAVIDDLVALTDSCAKVDENPCTNGTLHGAPPGSVEKLLAQGQAAASTGFSEQSFYIALNKGPPSLTVVAGVWGPRPAALLFSDAFVTSSANCPPRTPCAADANAFTEMMRFQAMKLYIVKSEDQPAGDPWRTLLPATASFYTLPEIRNNSLYRQYVKAVEVARPFPNSSPRSFRTIWASRSAVRSRRSAGSTNARTR